jgi:hypothetical protein
MAVQDAFPIEKCPFLRMISDLLELLRPLLIVLREACNDMEAKNGSLSIKIMRIEVSVQSWPTVWTFDGAGDSWKLFTKLFHSL